MRFPNLELVEECQSVGGNYCGEAQAKKRRKKKKKKLISESDIVYNTHMPT